MKMMDSWAQPPPSLQSHLPSHAHALLLAVMGCWGGQSTKKVISSHRECGKATDGTGVVQCSDTQQLSQGGKVQRRAASAIRNMFWAWGLEELKIGTCGPNYRTKEKRARKRNNLGKLGTVDQPEYCKQHEILLLLSLQKGSESCNRWPTLCMGIKCMGA